MCLVGICFHWHVQVLFLQIKQSRVYSPVAAQHAPVPKHHHAAIVLFVGFNSYCHWFWLDECYSQVMNVSDWNFLALPRQRIGWITGSFGRGQPGGITSRPHPTTQLFQCHCDAKIVGGARYIPTDGQCGNCHRHPLNLWLYRVKLTVCFSGPRVFMHNSN